MDQRSFDLNYENNILLCDAKLTAAVREQQEQFLVVSSPVNQYEIEAWSVFCRFWNKLLCMLGPVL
jgi:cardiolipin synthase